MGRWQLSRDALAGWKPIEGTGEKKGRVRVLGHCNHYAVMGRVSTSWTLNHSMKEEDEAEM